MTLILFLIIKVTCSLWNVWGKMEKLAEGRKKKSHSNSNKVIAVNNFVYFLSAIFPVFIYMESYYSLCCFFTGHHSARVFNIIKIIGKHNFLGYLAFCHTAVA